MTYYDNTPYNYYIITCYNMIYYISTDKIPRRPLRLRPQSPPSGTGHLPQGMGAPCRAPLCPLPSALCPPPF